MRSNTLTALFIGSIIGLGGIAHAEVYMHTDADGKVSFSDRPTPASKGENVEKVDIQETNSTPAVAPSATATSKSQSETDDYSIRITSPIDGATFTNEVRDLTISAVIEPSLEENHSLVATLNGQRASNQSSKGSTVVIQDINRGQQQVQLQLMNSSGNMVAQSQSVSVNIIRRNLPRATPRAN